MRYPVAFLAVLLLLVAVAGTVRAAEEVFILDNGTVFRGTVVRTDDRQVEVRLSGFGSDARVRILKARIVSRFSGMQGEPERTATARPPGTEVDWSSSAQLVNSSGMPTPSTSQSAIPAEEPSAKDEGFFHRLARVAVLSLPEGPAGRTSLALLLFVALLALVTLGCRLAEMDNIGLGRMTILAAILGVFLVADIIFHETLLRADRATWVLPLQGIVWLAATFWLLRCGMPRAILLFAFVLFSLAVMLFSAGAILVTF